MKDEHFLFKFSAKKRLSELEEGEKLAVENVAD